MDQRKRPPLPSWLKRTPQEIEAEKQVQAERQAGFTRAQLTEGEQLVSRGALLERTARANLALAEADGNVEQIAQSRTHLAAAFAMQGRYEEAANWSLDEEERRRYEEIHAALERDDAEKCDCDDIQGTYNDTEIAITPRFEERRVFSSKHGGVVSLVRCVKCGHLNGRAVSSRLLQARGVRERNRAAALGDGRGGARDVDLLKVNERT